MDNKKTLINNTLYILTAEGKRIEQLEKEIGVQAGYFEEMGKIHNSDLDANVVVALATALHMSVDTLLTVDLSSLSENVRFRISFLQKLLLDTKEDAIDWRRETREYLKYGLKSDFGVCEHPLFEHRSFYYEDENEELHQISRIIFPSYSYDIHTDIQGDSFRAMMKNGVEIFLMNVNGTSFGGSALDAYAKEVWICPPDGEKDFLCSSQDIPEISSLVERLYSEVRKNAMHTTLRKDIKSLLNNYLDNESTDGDIFSATIAV